MVSLDTQPNANINWLAHPDAISLPWTQSLSLTDPEMKGVDDVTAFRFHDGQRLENQQKGKQSPLGNFKKKKNDWTRPDKTLTV